MYRHRGNKKGCHEPRRPLPGPERMAVYRAESMKQRIAEGRSWTFAAYGTADKPERVALVTKHLE